MTAQHPIPTDNREASDGYRGQVFREGGWRVVVCRDGIQWILQARTRAGSPDGARWEGRHYFRRREALERLWREHTGLPAPLALALLPERFIRE